MAEHSFGILWVYVICQIMARERLQLTSWNLASEKYTDERFWLTGKISSFRSFHGNMNDWIQPWNFTFAELAKNSLIRFSDKLVHSLLQLIITIWNLFEQILTDGLLDNQ